MFVSLSWNVCSGCRRFLVVSPQLLFCCFVVCTTTSFRTLNVFLRRFFGLIFFSVCSLLVLLLQHFGGFACSIVSFLFLTSCCFCLFFSILLPCCFFEFFLDCLFFLDVSRALFILQTFLGVVWAWAGTGLHTVVAEMITELIHFEPDICICNRNELAFKRESVSVMRDFLLKFPQICLCNGN